LGKNAPALDDGMKGWGMAVLNGGGGKRKKKGGGEKPRGMDSIRRQKEWRLQLKGGAKRGKTP